MATPALVLSIVGLMCCFTGPIGLIMAVIDLKAIDNGQTDPEKRGTARAALILGAIPTALFVGLMVLWVVFGVVAVTGERPPN